MQFLIIGGSDAGISAALRAREVDPSAELTVLLEDDFPNYSICGLPFYLSGETPDWHNLAHRTEFDGIAVRRGHRATRIDPSAKTVEVHSEATGNCSFFYDKLLIGTGAGPVRPRVEGWELPGVFPLHTMKDSFAVHAYLQTNKPSRTVIIGAGYIGLEMADALTHRGIEVTVASHFRATGSNDFEQECEMVLIAVRVKPNAALGVEAGLKTGSKGALLTNRRMESEVPDIYVAGDRGETWHRLLNRFTYLPLGTTAHKQGRTAEENACGGNRQFAGSLGTQVVKIFDRVIARTGLRHDEALREAFHPFTAESQVNDHKAYYPGASPVSIRVTGDIVTGRLLGAQMLAHWGAEISKRVDIFATALFHQMEVEELSDLDLSYTPPLSSPWDPVQMAAHQWCNTLDENVVESGVTANR